MQRQSNTKISTQTAPEQHPINAQTTPKQYTSSSHAALQQHPDEHPPELPSRTKSARKQHLNSI
eukprot:4959980-Lingulodinium_polyedra.AAC.1